MAEFHGFPKDFARFFRELKDNNNRPWFTDNKLRYQQSVVAPMLSFIEAMGPRLRDISTHYRAIPKAHGGSLFRIYRDTRFSRDKTPYKTHAAAHFRHAAGRDAHAPGFYAHFASDGLAFGGGIWLPPSKHLLAIREFIVDNPAAWRQLREAETVQDRGGIRGAGLKRPPRGFPPDHVHVDDLKRKSFFIMAEAGPSLLGKRELLDEVTAAFSAAAPLNHFINDALELPF